MPTTLTILPPMPALGYETFDADWLGRSVKVGREEAMCGRDRDQLAFQDKQMVYIDHKLKEINGEDTEELEMPMFVYTNHKNGAFYGAKTQIFKDGKLERFTPGHLANNGTIKKVSNPAKGNGWPKLKNRPTVPVESRYGRSTSTQKIEL